MTLIIHIGPPKTGTSSIQDWLSKGSEKKKLEKYNTFYFSNSISNNDILFFLAHIDSPIPRKYAQDSSPEINLHKKRAERYIEDIRKLNNKDNLYISSSEYLFRLNKNEIIKLKQALLDIDEDIKIICFIRDPLNYIISQLCMNMRHRIEIISPSSDINLLDQLSLWESVFNEQFIPYSFENAVQEQNGITAAFQRIINELAFSNKPSKEIKIKTHDTKIKNSSTCAELLLATRDYRIKYGLKDDIYYDYLNIARRKIERTLADSENKIGTKIEYSEEAKIYFINKNKALYELLEDKYNFKSSSNWKDYLNPEKYKDLKDVSWGIDDIIRSYDKEKVELMLIILEMSISVYRLKKKRNTFPLTKFLRKKNKFPKKLKYIIKYASNLKKILFSNNQKLN